ncbi:hypothetical protein [Nocardia sp. NBC_01327]|uniref:hypothetical protein n=1 Tax=Nocardia sp. NBC_01327 TaxID=2903593 RepID=UPI002E13570E|nr:hypothetical protein OG326_28320 [Nocardia sp. NBC_01327]
MSDLAAPHNWDVIGDHPMDHPGELWLALTGRQPDWEDQHAKRGMLHDIRLTSAQLTMPTASELLNGRGLPVGGGAWGKYVLGIGEVAVRAASALISERERSYLLALLDIWAETVFADRSVRLWVGAGGERPCVLAEADRTSVAIGGNWKERRFVAASHGPVDAAEELSAIEFGWGDAAQLLKFTALVRDRGAAPWNPRACQVLSEMSGLTRVAAALVLSGYIEWTGRQELLNAQQRAILDVTAAEVVEAKRELEEYLGKEFGAATRLLTRALPEDPARLWEPDGLCVLAARIAEVSNAHYGRRITLSEGTLAAAEVIRAELAVRGGSRSAAGLCATVAAPASDRILTGVLDAPEAVRAWALHHRQHRARAGIQRPMALGGRNLPLGLRFPARRRPGACGSPPDSAATASATPPARHAAVPGVDTRPDDRITAPSAYVGAVAGVAAPRRLRRRLDRGRAPRSGQAMGSVCASRELSAR